MRLRLTGEGRTLWLSLCGVQFCALLLGLADQARAATRTVPTQHPSIQHGIWASHPGDTVLVLPGTYTQNVVVDRAIVVRSAQGPQVTIIDGSAPANPDSGSTVLMLAGRLQGFTVRNGSGTLNPAIAWRRGGGILVGEGTSCVIRSNWIRDNTLHIPASDPEGRGFGAGVATENFSAATISQNRIYNNRINAAGGSGAGLDVSGPASVVEDNEIFDNHVEQGQCGGVAMGGILRRNVIACNSAPGEGFAVRQSGVLTESNTIVSNWDLSLSEDPAAVRIRSFEPCDERLVFANVIAYNVGYGLTCLVNAPCQLEVGCNDFHGNSAGQTNGDCSNVIGTNNNIALDPQFGQTNCPPNEGDWCLSNGSPLLPENSPLGCGLIGARGLCSQIGIADPEGSPPATLTSPTAAPNPFPEQTTISFHLARAGAVEVAVHGVLGRRVRTLHEGLMAPGEQTLRWDGRTDEGARAASGAYVAIIRVGSEEVSRKLLLIR